MDKKDNFWAGVTVGKQREREKTMREHQNESNTRAPEVVEELSREAMFGRDYWMGISHGLKTPLEKIVNHLKEKNFNSDVTLKVSRSQDRWYLELEDGSGRSVRFGHQDLGVALEEIFR